MTFDQYIYLLHGLAGIVCGYMIVKAFLDW
jgi:hypothetical protein